MFTPHSTQPCAVSRSLTANLSRFRLPARVCSNADLGGRDRVDGRLGRSNIAGTWAVAPPGPSSESTTPARVHGEPSASVWSLRRLIRHERISLLIVFVTEKVQVVRETGGNLRESDRKERASRMAELASCG